LTIKHIVSSVPDENVVPCGPEDEIIGGCAVAGSNVDKVNPRAFRGLEVIGCD
jgi:hypothetical protein